MSLGQRAHNFKDLTGKVYGRLTVIKLHETGIKGGLKWECLCSCGNTKITRPTALVSGQCKSCGCASRDHLIHISFKGKGVSGFNQLKRSYIKSAKKRNIEFYLTDEELIWLFKQNCTYCGTPPSQLYLYIIYI